MVAINLRILVAYFERAAALDARRGVDLDAEENPP
jgi:hypothetical protein